MRGALISPAHDGMALDRPPFSVLPRPAAVPVVSGPRIGITLAAELPWRYGLGRIGIPQPPVPGSPIAANHRHDADPD